jgi:hypothetical protein
MQAVLIAVPWLFLAAIDVAVILAAFQTSFKLGVMAFFVPMYVVSFGNWRLRTKYRRRFAIAWWGGLACLILSIAATSR